MFNIAQYSIIFYIFWGRGVWLIIWLIICTHFVKDDIYLSMKIYKNCQKITHVASNSLDFRLPNYYKLQFIVVNA